MQVWNYTGPDTSPCAFPTRPSDDDIILAAVIIRCR